MKNMPFLVTWAIKVTVGCLILATAWVTWDNWGRFSFRSDSPLQTEALHTPTPQLLTQGEYLVRISGCMACHTRNSGEPLAGARRIETPFGHVFSSNLTPSITHGIGAWTFADFQTALRWGRSRDGRLLLPAFPYNHTSVFTPSDVRAMFAWLQSTKPIDTARPAHQLTWPVGTQPVIAVWRSLYFSPTPFKTDEQQSDIWNRGAYLVQSAGHCATCHGQRNGLGSFPKVDDLAGGFLSSQMWVAPSLLDPAQTALARSSDHDIAQLLRAGQNTSASVSGPMAEFVQHVGQHLSTADSLAIATYLKSRTEPSSHKRNIHSATVASSTPAAQTIYVNHCATCHGANGEGKTGRYPSLASNPAVVLAQPDNLIQMILYGGYGPSTHDRPRPFGMPPYLFTLNNQQIADVLNHIRSQWGHKAPAVSAVQVDRVRSAAY